MSDDQPALEVTDTEVTARRSIAGSVELKALQEWARPFGFDPACQPIDRPIVRDVTRRRICYSVVDCSHSFTSVDDCIRDEYVQLEATPPPWPPQIARWV